MKDSKGYYRYKGFLGGVVLGLLLSLVIGIAFGDPVTHLLQIAMVALVVLGPTLGAIFPKYFAWAWHLIPFGGGDH